MIPKSVEENGERQLDKLGELLTQKLSESPETTLLPCPFCGGTPFVQIIEAHKHTIANLPDYGGGATIECSCGCGLICDTLEEVTVKWNTRQG